MPTDDRPVHGAVSSFLWGDRRLAYEVRGAGGRPFVLIHGLLIPSGVNGEVATRLVERGNTVILFDLLGHGRSEKSLSSADHRLEYAGEQVVALLDHLGIDRAVVGGMSLGANVALQVAVEHPDRVTALVCEMPVLERGTVGVMLALLPLLAALQLAAGPARALFRLVGRLPRTSHEPLNAVLDTGTEPLEMAAVMRGYAAGPVCPPGFRRRSITGPVLVIGHRGDVMHPFDDAETLVAELPDATLIDARSFFELRTRPERLVGLIGDFLDAVHESR